MYACVCMIDYVCVCVPEHTQTRSISPCVNSLPGWESGGNMRTKRPHFTQQIPRECSEFPQDETSSLGILCGKASACRLIPLKTCVCSSAVLCSKDSGTNNDIQNYKRPERKAPLRLFATFSAYLKAIKRKNLKHDTFGNSFKLLKSLLNKHVVFKIRALI